MGAVSLPKREKGLVQNLRKRRILLSSRGRSSLLKRQRSALLAYNVHLFHVFIGSSIQRTVFLLYEEYNNFLYLYCTP